MNDIPFNLAKYINQLILILTSALGDPSPNKSGCHKSDPMWNIDFNFLPTFQPTTSCECGVGWKQLLWSVPPPLRCLGWKGAAMISRSIDTWADATCDGRHLPVYSTGWSDVQ